MIVQYQDAWIQILLNISKRIDSLVSCSGKHSTQVAKMAGLVSKKLGWDEADVESLSWAAELHDIGKIGVPEEILSKAGPLSDQEWMAMKLHPMIGANIVKSLQKIAHLAPIIRHHQEKYDGSGYPDGLRGREIPLGARILAVIDAYEAMTNDRVYRKARSHCEAALELRQLSDKHFDREIVEIFLEVIEQEEMRIPAAQVVKEQKIPRPSGTKDYSAVPPCLPTETCRITC